MIRTRKLGLVLALVAAAAAACDSAAPLGPSEALESIDALDDMLASASGERSQETAEGSRGVSLFDTLAQEVPGFAGLYRTGRCAIVVVLTAEGDRAQALPVVRRLLTPILERSCGDAFTLRTQGGEFTYLELKRYLAAAAPVASMRGVNRPYLDFQLNGLVIPVASREVAEAVMGRLHELGIPRAAVVFVAA